MPTAEGLRDIARAALAETRVWGAPRVASAALRLHRFAGRVDAGEVRLPAARLGRAARFVPRAARVADALRGGARVIMLASDTMSPPPQVDGIVLRPWTGAPGAAAMAARAAQAGASRQDSAAQAEGRPAATPDPVAAAAPASRPRSQRPPPLPAPRGDAPARTDRDMLEAIRAMMRAEVRPARPERRPPPPPPRRGAAALPPLEPADMPPPGPVAVALGTALGWSLVALMLPVGLARTGLSLWRGEGLPKHD